jgi:nuclear transport factor 2 (NTF2) superfamily protein
MVAMQSIATTIDDLQNREINAAEIHGVHPIRLEGSNRLSCFVQPRRTKMATAAMTTRPPLPPFTHESAIHKVRLAEDGWNTRDSGKVALAYALDSRWRNRSEFVNGRNEIIAFLSRKWARELDYRLIKELWAFIANRIAVRFAYEWHDDSGHWYRSYGNENWEFNDDGLMASRFASINDLPILESDRKYHWPLGRRPDDHPGLSELGL